MRRSSNQNKQEANDHGKINQRQFYPGYKKVTTLCFFVVMSTLTFVRTRKLSTTMLLQNEPLILRQQTYENANCSEVGNSKDRVVPSLDSDECLLFIKPDAYIQLLMDVLVGLPSAGRCVFERGCKPPHRKYKEKRRRFGNDWPPNGYTMIGKERLNNFRNAILEVNSNKIPGAIAEFGVWRGGGMIMAAVLQKYDIGALDRDLYLFDAYQAFGGYNKRVEKFLAVSLDEVKKNVEFFDVVVLNKIHFVKGLFQDSTKEWVNRDDPIAVLRVDGNFYDSYQDVLYAVYKNVPVGGIVIFDDVMSHEDVMRCWLDFKADHGIAENLVQIDDHSAWFRKKVNTPIDQSKKRNPEGF